MSMSDVLKDTAKYLDSFLSQLSKCGIIGNYTILFLELATFDSYEEACIRDQICQLIVNLQKVLQMLDSYLVNSKVGSLQKSPDYFLSNEPVQSSSIEFCLMQNIPQNSVPVVGNSKAQGVDRMLPLENDSNYQTLCLNMKKRSLFGSVEEQQTLSRCALQPQFARESRDSNFPKDVKDVNIKQKGDQSRGFYGSLLPSHKNEEAIKDSLPSRIGRIVEESLKSQIYDLSLAQRQASYSSENSQQDNLCTSHHQESNIKSDFVAETKPHNTTVVSDDEDQASIYASDYAIGRDEIELPQDESSNKEKETPPREKEYSKTVFANIVKFNPSDLDQHPWCQLCQREFPSSGSLKRHLTTSHNEVHWCHTCLKNFSSKKDMKCHIIKDHPEATNICFSCGKKFKSHSNLRRHMMIHRGQRGTACEICGQTFARSEYCREHKRVHTGEKPFTCDVCKKTFSKSSNLSAHALIHKPKSEGHKCNMCPKTFRRLDKLKEHTMRHLKIKRFQCGLCLKAYSEKRDLAKHMKTLHTRKEDETR